MANNKVKIELEFDSFEEAFVALGAIAEHGPKSMQVKSLASPPPTTPGPAAIVAKEAEANLPKPPSAAVQKLLDQHGLSAGQVTGTGKNGAITKKDVESFITTQGLAKSSTETTPPAEAPAASSEPASSGATLDDARAAMKTVNDSRDMQVCINLLSRFGVRRVSDLDAEKFPDFVKRCEEVAAGAEV